MILGYLVIGGIIVSVIDAIFDDTQLALFCGLIWPLSVPLLIGVLTITFIGVKVSDIIDFIVHR